MDRAKKRLVSAIDGIRAQFTDADSQEEACGSPYADSTLPGTAASRGQQLQMAARERLEPANCRLARIVRHGFPNEPKCLAVDPVQKLCAIGAARGCVRLLGQAGVDHLLKHDSDEPVIHVQFLVNEGGLVTALRDDTLHLWNYRQRVPEVVHSLRMAKERVSAIHLPFQSKWLAVGTDKGNVYFVSLGTFELSPQIIYWNKAVDMTCRTHPGSIRQLESSPTEPSKLLIVFDKGHLVLWNMLAAKGELPERFIAATELSPVTAVSWHADGKQFMCGHQNGSLSIWGCKRPRECVHRSVPHSPNLATALGEEQPPTGSSTPAQATNCKAIGQLSWSVNGEGEQLVVFTGGMPAEEGALPSLTVLRAKGSLTVLEMDHPIVSMLPLNTSPYASVPQHPPAIAVLLRNDLLVVDMLAQGYPCFEVPHPMDLHESPVTLLRYYSDCPVEMIAALTLVGRNQRRQGVRLSEKQWPINGGIGRECATGYQEMLLTGHEDGSIKFWQASSEQLQVMYKLKTGRHFEKSAAAHRHHQQQQQNAAGNEEKPQMAPLSHAIAAIELCVDSRQLLVASSSGQVTMFRFAKTECCQEIAVIPLPQLCRTTCQAFFSPSCPPSPSHKVEEQQAQATAAPQHHQNRLKQQSRSSTSSGSGATGQQQGKAELRRQDPATEPPHQQPSRTSSHSTDTASMGSQQQQQQQQLWANEMPLKVRGGALRRPGGYQPELVCQVPWVGGLRPEPVTALALSSAYGLVALGTAVGLALVDTQTASLVYAWSNAELLGREPVPFWSSLTSQETVTSPTLELTSTISSSQSQSPPSPPTSSTSTTSANANHQQSVQRPNSRSLRARLKHQFSTQTPPVLTQKTPGPPLSRGITTDSAQHDNGHRLSTTPFGSRLGQRPQLIKAFTFNPNPANSTNNSGQKGEDGGQQQPAGDGQNCNGHLGSRASSSESLEKDGQPVEDTVCSLAFINCPSKRGVQKWDACLWLGTCSGASLAFQLQLPQNRATSSVVVAPAGSIVRLSGRLLCLAFLDRNFCLLAGPTESFRSAQQQEKEPTGPAPQGEAETGGQVPRGEGQKPNKVLTKANQSPLLSSASHPSTTASEQQQNSVPTQPEEEFLQIAFFVGESEVRAVGLPAYRQLFHRQFIAHSAEEVPLVRATATHLGGQPALVVLNAAGAIVVLSLPSLRTLLHVPLLPHSVDIDDRICLRYQMSEHGLGMFMCSPSEVQKFTVCADIAAQVADCMGELFVPCDMPEPPKAQSFLRGVMSSLAAAAGAGGSSTGYAGEQLAEIDAILSEKPASSVAASQVRTVAKPLLQAQQQQLGGIELGTSRTITAGQAAREAMQNLSERNDRLNAVSDATEQLRNNAMTIQNRSAKLLEKYEKKKWYQL